MNRTLALTAVALLALSLAARGAMPSGYAERVALAIYHAEGGKRARVPYGILSVKVKDEAEARSVCLRTIRHCWRDWEAAGRPDDFLEALARRYAPIGSANDPRNLNRNWLQNVRKLMK